MTRAAIYVRVSTSSQEHDGTSLDSQAAAARAYAAERGYDVVRLYSDTHTGSELWERPQLTELRRSLADYDVLIVYALDRLARRTAHQMIIAEECVRAGVELLSVTEQIDRTPTGELIAFVRGWAAELEREKIRERTMRGKQERIRQGKLPGAGSELYGYRRDRVAGVREIVEPEAQVVRQIFELMLAGKGCAAIATIFNRRGIPSPASERYPDRVTRWWEGHLHELVTNPAYKGESWVFRWQVTHKPGRKRSTTLRDKAEWVQLPEGVTPAIVDAATWDAAQRRLAANRGTTARNAQRQYLLRGRVTCSVCGMRCYSDRDNGKAVYRCCSRHYRAGGNCGASRIPVDIEAWVWEQVSVTWKDPQILLEEIGKRDDGDEERRLRTAIDMAKARLKKIERGADALLKRYRESADELPWAPFQRQLAEADTERATIREEIATLEAQLETVSKVRADVDALPALCAAIAERAENADFDARCDLLFALDAQIRGAGLEWELTWSMPVDAAVVAGHPAMTPEYTHISFVRRHAGPRRVKPHGLRELLPAPQARAL